MRTRLLEPDIAVGQKVEVEGGRTLPPQCPVVGAKRRAVSPAFDDLGLRLGEESGKRLLPGHQLDGRFAGPLRIELLLELHSPDLSPF
jgi:hypothetical protein